MFCGAEIDGQPVGGVSYLQKKRKIYKTFCNILYYLLGHYTAQVTTYKRKWGLDLLPWTLSYSY